MTDTRLRSRSGVPCVALLPRHMTSWAELVPLAQSLKSYGRVQPVIILASKKIAGREQELKDKGLDYLDVGEEFLQYTQKFDAEVSSGDAIDGNGLLQDIRLAVKYSFELNSEYVYAKNILAFLDAKVLILPGDRELSPVPAFIKAAKSLGIRSVVAATSIPYLEGVSVPRAGNRQFSVKRKDNAPILNQIMGACTRSQVRDTKHGVMLFSPGWRLLGLAISGMLAPNPWVQGGGKSDFILQHSSSKMELYKSLGCAPEKFVFLGDQTLDPVYRSIEDREPRRAKLLKALELNAEEPIFVMAVPNEAEHDLCTMSEHLSRQRYFWSVLASRTSNVILALHPKSKRSDYAELASEFGFKFSTLQLSEIIGVADVFICSCSTTSYWAMIAGVPVINWDYLDLDMSLFKGLPGVYQVVTPDQFEKLMHELDCKIQIDRVAMELQAKQLANEAMFDGQALKRICVFIDELAKSKGER